jgi:hypothetical protein
MHDVPRCVKKISKRKAKNEMREKNSQIVQGGEKRGIFWQERLNSKFSRSAA